MTKRFLATVASALAISQLSPGVAAAQIAPSPAASNTGARVEPKFGLPLDCTINRRESTAAIAQARFTASEAAAALGWAEVELRRVGYASPRPSDASAGYIAALARSGRLVAAKIANDDLVSASKGYAHSAWAIGIEAFLTIQTQPVNHASYPTSVRAEGEQPEQVGAHQHGYSVDLEETSAALREIIGRAALSKRALGSVYSRPAVRYYLLAQGFRDEVALEASAARVCRLKLPAADVNKLDISARMMAMPTRSEAGAKQ